MTKILIKCVISPANLKIFMVLRVKKTTGQLDFGEDWSAEAGKAKREKIGKGKEAEGILNGKGNGNKRGNWKRPLPPRCSLYSRPTKLTLGDTRRQFDHNSPHHSFVIDFLYLQIINLFFIPYKYYIYGNLMNSYTLNIMQSKRLKVWLFL